MSGQTHRSHLSCVLSSPHLAPYLHRTPASVPPPSAVASARAAMPTSTYPPLRPVEPRPPILPAPASADGGGDYRLPSSSAGTPSAEAGPSSAGAGSSPAGSKRRPAAPGTAKKRRSGMLDDGHSESGNGDPDTDTPGQGSAPAKQRDGPKKKKAARACFLCQKAHLTCDDGSCVLQALKLCQAQHHYLCLYYMQRDHAKDV